MKRVKSSVRGNAARFGNTGFVLTEPTYAGWRQNAHWLLNSWTRLTTDHLDSFPENLRPRVAGGKLGPESIYGQFALLNVCGPEFSEDSLGTADYVNTCLQTHFLLRWASFGYPTFQLSHGLAAKLLLTDSSGISRDDLGWPFESFMICLPGPDSPITYADGETGREVSASMIAIHKFQAIANPTNSAFSLKLGAGTFAHVLDQADTSAVMFSVQSSQSYSTLTRTFIEPRDQATLSAFLTANQDINPEAVTAGFVIANIDSLANKAAARLAVNLALYLGDLSARNEYAPNLPHNAKQLARTKLGSGKLQPPLRWELGQNIKLAPALRNLARSSASTEPAWKLSARFLVRGHWRNQAVGPGWGQHRKTWIEPFLKGPPAGELLARSYEIGDIKK